MPRPPDQFVEVKGQEFKNEAEVVFVFKPIAKADCALDETGVRNVNGVPGGGQRRRGR